jgi:tRNA pseudouridine38-40 synthase
VNVLRIETVSHRFHARHSAMSRAYVYQIARRRTAFAKPFVWWVKEPLDVEAMRAAAAQFMGFKDFQSFTDDDPDEKSTTVQLERVDVIEDGALLLIRVEGSHFLWKMVRRIVGVLVAVGKGELKASAIGRLLSGEGGGRGGDADASDAPARLTAPASGLFLERVTYEGDDDRATFGPFLRLPRA